MDEDQKKRLWGWFDEHRSSKNINDPNFILRAFQETGVDYNFEVLNELIERYYKYSGLFSIPKNLHILISKILPQTSVSVLAPYAGIGLLPLGISKKKSNTNFDLIISNHNDKLIAEKILPANSNILFGDQLDCIDKSKKRYDAVVSLLPFGLRSNTTQINSLQYDDPAILGELKKFALQDYGLAIAFYSCTRLKDDGIACFSFASSILHNKMKIRELFRAIGCDFYAFIHLPFGSFAPYTNLESYLVVVGKQKADKLFVGQFYPDENHINELVNNYLKRGNGKLPAQGCVVSFEEFDGFQSIENNEKISAIVQRMGLQPIQFRDLVKNIKLADKSEAGEMEHLPNSVYLPLMANTKAPTSQELLPTRLKSYLRMVVNPDIASAEIVARMLNTPLGLMIRDNAKTGTTIPRINKENLIKATFYLPPKENTQKILTALNSIETLRNEINEIEGRIWDRPQKIDKYLHDLKKYSNEDRFQDWVDSLPFPLASVLWRYHTHSGSAKERMETLIQFFEVLTEFLAIIHLSAYKSNPNIWEEKREQLLKALAEANLTYDRASFGTWKCTVEFLSKMGRKMLASNEERDLIISIYKTKDTEIFESIFSSKLIEVINSAVNMRNDYPGHGGALGDAFCLELIQKLEASLQTVRGIFKNIWERYQLVLPSDMIYKDQIYHYKKSRKITGNRTPFEFISMSSIEPFESDRLYLKDTNESNGLKILNLIRMGPAPQSEPTACYFYNKHEKKGFRFVSYHYGDKPEIFESNSEMDEISDLLKFDNGKNN